MGLAADHGGNRHDRLQEVVEVIVGAGHHPHEEIAGAGDGVDLEHLGDAGERRHGAGVGTLGDLECGEGQNA